MWCIDRAVCASIEAYCLGLSWIPVFTGMTTLFFCGISFSESLHSLFHWNDVLLPPLSSQRETCVKPRSIHRIVIPAKAGIQESSTRGCGARESRRLDGTPRSGMIYSHHDYGQP